MTLRESWELRNAAAQTLIKIEHQLRDILRTASLEDVIALLDSFSPARSPGPEWTRSFDPLVEHLWTYCDPSLLVQLESTFRERGRGWESVANALQPENGQRVRSRLEHPPVPSRVPPFTLG